MHMFIGIPDAIMGSSHACQPTDEVHQLVSMAVREVGNGSSTNDSNIPARWPRYPATRARNIAEIKRAKGEVYNYSPSSGAVIAPQRDHLVAANVENTLNRVCRQKRKF